MLDLDVFRRGTVRGATIAQLGTSVAMTGVMFSLVLHFQYAYGWSPVRAGLASLPMIVTMLLSNPLTESMVSRLGHRVACLVGAGLLAVGLVTMAYAVEHGYPAIVVAMVVMVVGLRTVMMTCAVALIGAMPGNRTSLGAALNDTAQELGTSVGTALVGTLLATLVVQVLPTGAWTPDLVASFFHGERIVFLVLAVVSGSIAAYGASTLTDSRDTEEA
jgi:fucose permease